MVRNHQPKGGSYAGNKGNKTYVSGGRSGGNKQQAVAAATVTALGLGVPQQSTVLTGMAGLGMVQQNSAGLAFRIYRDEHCGRAWWLRRRWLTVR